MENNISVSIIIPVYNAASFIDRCIMSLINQTLPDIEIIAVNDCSTDNSYAILETYALKYPDKIKLIDSKINMKQGGARNLGMNIAKGEYVGFVDSDDWVEYDMFARMYNMAKVDNSDLVICDYDKTDGDVFIPYKSIETSHDNGADLTRTLLVSSIPIVACLYRRSMLLENYLFFPKDLFYEDNMWEPLVFLYVKKASRIDEVCYHYFTNMNSTTHRKNDNRIFDRMLSMEIFLKEVKSRNLYCKYQDEIDFIFVKLYFLVTAYQCVAAFSKIQFGKLYEIRSRTRDVVPNFRKNKYYKHIFAVNEKICYNVCMLSPIFYALMISVYVKIKK